MHKGVSNKTSVRSVASVFFPETVFKISDHSLFSKLRKRPKLFFPSEFKGRLPDFIRWRLGYESVNYEISNY